MVAKQEATTMTTILSDDPERTVRILKDVLRKTEHAIRRAIVIENIHKSWAIRVHENTPEGVEIRPTWEDVEHLVEEIIRSENATRGELSNDIYDIDVFDSMRWLLDQNIDLDDHAAVERALIGPYGDDPHTRKRFIDWCIKAARANKAAGGLRRNKLGGVGFVPNE